MIDAQYLKTIRDDVARQKRAAEGTIDACNGALQLIEALEKKLVEPPKTEAEAPTVAAEGQ